MTVNETIIVRKDKLVEIRDLMNDIRKKLEALSKNEQLRNYCA